MRSRVLMTVFREPFRLWVKVVLPLTANMMLKSL
nr:MAG TPA: hypothetical protein [Caudoviricetes sp.]